MPLKRGSAPPVCRVQSHHLHGKKAEASQGDAQARAVSPWCHRLAASHLSTGAALRAGQLEEGEAPAAQPVSQRGAPHTPCSSRSSLLGRTESGKGETSGTGLCIKAINQATWKLLGVLQLFSPNIYCVYPVPSTSHTCGRETSCLPQHMFSSPLVIKALVSNGHMTTCTKHLYFLDPWGVGVSLCLRGAAVLAWLLSALGS